MALRSIDQRYWTDPYVESLSATEKLVYIHLFSSAHTNLVGVFQASRRMIDPRRLGSGCGGPGDHGPRGGAGRNDDSRRGCQRGGPCPDGGNPFRYAHGCQSRL